METVRHYDQRYFNWQSRDIDAKVRAKAKLLAQYVKDSDTLLDFGCGGGGTLMALQATVKIGVEINAAARAAAKETYNLDVLPSLDEVPDGTVDVIVANHVLEHLATPFEVLKEMRTKLAPGGRLVLVLPIDDWRVQKTWDESDINHHLYTWTPLLIGNLLRDAGYRPLELKIIHRSYMRGLSTFAKLPEPVFEAVRMFYSRVRHRQELLALAIPEQQSV